MENYKIDRTLFTNTELLDILAELRSLDSVNGTNRYGKLMEKLSAGSSDFMVGNQSVLIDLSSGRVFHAPKGKACPIYGCAVHKKRFVNCAECAGLPCDVWKATRDPQLSEAEFARSIEERIKNLRN